MLPILAGWFAFEAHRSSLSIYRISWVLFLFDFFVIFIYYLQAKTIFLQQNKANQEKWVEEATLPSNHHPWTYRLYTLSINFIDPQCSIVVVKYNCNFRGTSLPFCQDDPLSCTHPSLTETPSWNRVIGFALCLYLCIWCRGITGRKSLCFAICSMWWYNVMNQGNVFSYNTF